jgi:protein involved in polysaccharide export with SLBB domain
MQIHRFAYHVLLITGIWLSLIGVALAQKADPDVTPTTRIVAGCVLEIIVVDEPALSGFFTVDAQGQIQFALTDEAGGNKQEWKVTLKEKTTDEARAAVVESLKTYLKNPIVQLVIARLPGITIEISGPVKKPGSLKLRRTARLSDALEAAVYLPEADLSTIRILRLEKKSSAEPARRTITLDFTKYLSGESEEDPALEQGDKIVLIDKPVPVAPERPRIVRVRGEVRQEGTYPIGPKERVRDLLERAGGLLETADREKVILIRASDGKYLELNANRVLESDPVHNLSVEPGDLLLIGKRDQSLIFTIAGEVADPKTIPWKSGEKITLLQALELAGGPTRRADTRKGMLQRGYLRNPNLARIISFDVEKIRKNEEPDWEIEAGDMIVLPPRVRRPSTLQQFLPLLRFFLPFPF